MIWMLWHKGGPPRGGGGVPVPLFPWNKLACSPVPEIWKIWFSMFPVPQYCPCSPVPLKIWPLFPCSPKINALVPVPQNPWEGLTKADQWLCWGKCNLLLFEWTQIFGHMDLEKQYKTCLNLLEAFSFITLTILSFRTDRSGQTVQTQIRPLLKERDHS